MWADKDVIADRVTMKNSKRPSGFQNRFAARMMFSAVLSIAAAAGCGTTVKRGATEQLLTSDAVDRTIAQFDFRDLSGKKVYLDTQYIQAVKGIGFVNSAYIISSLRQQLVAARCLLQNKKDDADYIVEARVGALGLDSHEITYGIPASNALSTAASLVPTAPPLPTIPEISFAKKKDQLAAAKIAVFAYNRKTRQPVWQSGVNESESTAKDTWVFGAGPFQRGTIYEGTQFAGTRLGIPFFRRHRRQAVTVSYRNEVHFRELPLKPNIAATSATPPAGKAPAQSDKPTKAASVAKAVSASSSKAQKTGTKSPTHDDKVVPASGTSVGKPAAKTGSSTENRPSGKQATSTTIIHREPARLFMQLEESDRGWLKPRLSRPSGVFDWLPSLVPHRRQ